MPSSEPRRPPRTKTWPRRHPGHGPSPSAPAGSLRSARRPSRRPTTPLTAPGRATRPASRNAADGSGRCCRSALAKMASKLASSNGRSSTSPAIRAVVGCSAPSGRAGTRSVPLVRPDRPGRRQRTVGSCGSSRKQRSRFRPATPRRGGSVNHRTWRDPLPFATHRRAGALAPATRGGRRVLALRRPRDTPPAQCR